MLNIGPHLICLWKISPSEESWEVEVVPTLSRKLCLRRKSTSIRLGSSWLHILEMTRDHSNTSQNISPTPASWQELPLNILKNIQISFGGLWEPTNFFIKLPPVSNNFPLKNCPFCIGWSQIRAVRLYPTFVCWSPLWQAHCGALFLFMPVSKARCRDTHFCSEVTWPSVKGGTTWLLHPKEHVDTYSDNMGTSEASPVMEYLPNGFTVYGVTHFSGT